MWVKSYMLLLFILYVILFSPKIVYTIMCFHHFATNKIYIICKYYKPFILKLLYLLFKPNNATILFFLCSNTIDNKKVLLCYVWWFIVIIFQFSTKFEVQPIQEWYLVNMWTWARKNSLKHILVTSSKYSLTKLKVHPHPPPQTLGWEGGNFQFQICIMLQTWKSTKLFILDTNWQT
jgi:hypothetical protein